MGKGLKRMILLRKLEYCELCNAITHFPSLATYANILVQ